MTAAPGLFTTWNVPQQAPRSLRQACALQVEWEEKWWEASDWGGMREMGAEKSGCSIDGSAWRETWREAIAFDEATGEPLVERSAHKWAHTAKASTGKVSGVLKLHQ